MVQLNLFKNESLRNDWTLPQSASQSAIQPVPRKVSFPTSQMKAAVRAWLRKLVLDQIRLTTTGVCYKTRKREFYYQNIIDGVIDGAKFTDDEGQQVGRHPWCFLKNRPHQCFTVLVVAS